MSALARELLQFLPGEEKPDGVLEGIREELAQLQKAIVS